MRVLITGGAGFIGSHLCEKFLSEGHRVISVDNFDDFYNPAIKKANIRQILRHSHAKNFTSLKADIRDRKKINTILKSHPADLVLHLAAMVGVRPSVEKPSVYTDVNVMGTLSLLDVCQRNGVKKFILASSSSVYGNNKKVPFSESDNVDNPISPYAATKKSAELLGEAYSRLGMGVVALRFFTAYGPRQRPDLAIHKFVKGMVEGKKLPFYGDGKTSRDYTYVADIVEGISRAAAWLVRQKKPVLFEIFNLGESKTVTLKEVVSCLERTLKKKARLQRLPLPVGDVKRTFADISKARKVFGYKPKTDFKDGIASFIQWYLASQLR